MNDFYYQLGDELGYSWGYEDDDDLFAEDLSEVTPREAVMGACLAAAVAAVVAYFLGKRHGGPAA